MPRASSRPSRSRTAEAGAALELAARPRRRRPAAGSCRAASARAAPASIGDRPGRRQRAGDPLLVGVGRASPAAATTVARAPSSSRADRMVVAARGDHRRAAGAAGDPRGGDLGAHAAGADARRRGAAGIGLDLAGRSRRRTGCVARRDRAPDRRCRGRRRRRAGSAGRSDHLRDARREPVIVAVAQLVGGDAVILVDHRQRLWREQHLDRRARVEPAPAPLGIVDGQQQLRGREWRAAPAPPPRPASAASGRPRRPPACGRAGPSA